MAANAAYVAIRQLGKFYVTRTGEHIRALADVTFDVREHEFLSIVGPSGCGKSTLLRLLAGLIPHSEGEILINGMAVTTNRRDVGIVFQSPVLLPWQTVLENVLLPVRLMRLDEGRCRNHALSLLELVGLTGFEKTYPNELSGGMQQRVSLARALVHDPKFLLMDEPFGALDAMTREQLNLELLRIWHLSKKTIIFVTHSITEAVFLANRVVVLGPRPATVREIVEVDIPQPRDLSLLVSGDMAQYVASIRRALGLT